MKFCGVYYDQNVYLEVFQILLQVCFITLQGRITAMKEHLKSSLEIIETHYPNSGIVLAGYFNQLDFNSTAKLFNLKPAMNFPTRGINTLDQIYTNIKNFYNSAENGPPFGLSDHVTITLIPAKRVTPKNDYKSTG